MSNKIKNVQVKVPEKLYNKAKIKLLKKGLTWQDFLERKIEILVKGKKG